MGTVIRADHGNGFCSRAVSGIEQGRHIVEKMYDAHDNLGIAVTLKADGTIDKRVIGSVAEAHPLDSGNETAYGRLKEITAYPHYGNSYPC